jgi:adenosylcobinamide kinase / adenosylcobinamide-phosphate guanylyltransferase
VLGGARSGKSAAAEAMVLHAKSVDYIATGEPPDGADQEWSDRVLGHRARRPAHWRTIETLDLEAALGEPRSAAPALIDCLTTWLARVMDDCGLWEARPGADDELEQRTSQLVGAYQSARRRVVTVSNEVGSGIVPQTASGRRFRDELGLLNQRIATASHEVWLCTAGIARRLK